MRTLKKTLALVLVVAMMMSLCITSNAAFTDADKIEYTEAVEVMTAIGVIEGFPAGDFQPQGSLTRAQAAKILVYLLGAENEALADGQIFDDVKENHWAADYIAYCAENGLVNGYGDGKFGPEDKLTGYQWAKMLLAALGVDTTEMIGAAWQIPVATAAAEYGIFAGNEKADKTEICSREEACLYALNAAKVGVSVKYAVTLGDKIVAKYNTITEASLAAIAMGPQYDVEKIYSDASLLYNIHGVIYDAYQDAWGRPGVCYYNAKGSIFLVYLDTPDAVYTTAVDECTISSDIGLNKDNEYVLYTNGQDSSYDVQPLDTVQTIGAQGTLVEVYGKDIIVVIDTFLAKVTDVKAATYDKAGHKASNAQIELEVYNGETAQTITQTNRYANYTYSVGDYVLINAYTENDVAYVTGDVTVGDIATEEGSNAAVYVEILGLAETMVGAQTFLWYNAARHTIDKVDYYDAKWFELDEAGLSTADHTWFFDQYGNLIGATDIATVYAYGIIKDIQWINPVGASGYAQATIVYMDGSEEVKVVASIDNLPTAYAGRYGKGQIQNSAIAVSTNYDNNADLCGKHLFRIETGRSGLILTHVATYDKDGKLASKNEIKPATIKTGVSTIASGVYANDNTVYLVQTAIGPFVNYSVVIGYENIDSYTKAGDCVIDYVNNDADPYVDYVYVIGTADSATSKGIFLRTADSVKVVPNVFGSVDHYELTGLLDGEPATIKVAPKVYKDVLETAVLATVTFTDGVVDAAWNIGAYDGIVWANDDLYIDYQAPAAKGTVTKDGGVLDVNGVKYNVVGVTPVVGEWAADLSSKYVYVVYDAITGVDSVYILDAASSSRPSGDKAPVADPDSVTYVVEVYNKYGVLVNTIVAAKWNNATDATGVSYEDLLTKMQSTTPDANWTNYEGALNALLALNATGIEDIDVDASTGIATFVFNADAEPQA